MTSTDKQSVAFLVRMERRPGPSRPPKRLARLNKQKSIISTEDLIDKQRQADERRKKYEEDKLQRIKQRYEECKHLNETVSELLEQDAKHQGVEGTNSICAMSTREVAHKVKNVAQHFSQLDIQLNQDTDVV